MARIQRKMLFADTNATKWALDEDVFLMDNQDMSLEEQAARLNRTVDEIISRRATLGILQRTRALIKLNENA